MMNKAKKEPALEVIEEETPLQLPHAIQTAIAPLIVPIKARQAELAEQMQRLVDEMAKATEQQAEFSMDKGTVKANFKKYHALTARITELGAEQQLIEAEMERVQQQLKDTMEPTRLAHPIVQTVARIEQKLRDNLTRKINGIPLDQLILKQLEAERRGVTNRFAELVTTLELLGADVTGVKATRDAFVEAINDESVEKFLPPAA
jgi:elongation factor P--beta-lysine ligase